MNTPDGDVKICSLGKKTELNGKAIASVKMLGSNEKLSWNQNNVALVIKKPVSFPQWKVVTFAVEFKK